MAKSTAFNPLEGWPQQNKIGDYITIASDNTGGNVAYSATFNFNQRWGNTVRVSAMGEVTLTPTSTATATGTPTANTNAYSLAQYNTTATPHISSTPHWAAAADAYSDSHWDSTVTCRAHSLTCAPK